MPTLKLTKKTLDALQDSPPDTKILYWDTELRRFGAVLYPSGAITFVIQYRNQAGASRKHKIGVFGSTPLEEARRRASVLLGRVDNGEDPQEQRKADRKAITLSDFCDLYFAAAQRGAIKTRFGRPKTERTLYSDAGRIKHHIKPLLGKMRLVAVTRRDVAEFIAAVERGDTKSDRKTETLARGATWKTEKPRSRTIVRGGPGTAGRTAALLSGIFAYAVESEIRETNPVHGVRRAKTNKRNIYLTPGQLQRIGSALEKMEAEGFNPVFAAAIRFCALTGCRLSEIQALSWREIDFERSMLRLESTKTGSSIRPLSQIALSVFPSRIPDCQWVFPSPRSESGHIIGAGVAFLRVAEEAQVPLHRVAFHIFRHTFSTIASELGYVEATRAAMLGQSTYGTNAIYTHTVDHVLLAAANRVAGHIGSLMGLSRAEPARMAACYAEVELGLSFH